MLAGLRLRTQAEYIVISQDGRNRVAVQSLSCTSSHAIGSDPWDGVPPFKLSSLDVAGGAVAGGAVPNSKLAMQPSHGAMMLALISARRRPPASGARAKG